MEKRRRNRLLEGQNQRVLAILFFCRGLTGGLLCPKTSSVGPFPAVVTRHCPPPCQGGSGASSRCRLHGCCGSHCGGSCFLRALLLELLQDLLEVEMLEMQERPPWGCRGDGCCNRPGPKAHHLACHSKAGRRGWGWGEAGDEGRACWAAEMGGRVVARHRARTWHRMGGMGLGGLGEADSSQWGPVGSHEAF